MRVGIPIKFVILLQSKAWTVWPVAGLSFPLPLIPRLCLLLAQFEERPFPLLSFPDGLRLPYMWNDHERYVMSIVLVCVALVCWFEADVCLDYAPSLACFTPSAFSLAHTLLHTRSAHTYIQMWSRLNAATSATALLV